MNSLLAIMLHNDPFNKTPLPEDHLFHPYDRQDERCKNLATVF